MHINALHELQNCSNSLCLHFSHFLVYVVFISSIHVIVHESFFHGKWLNLRLHDCVWSWKCVRAFRATATMSKCQVWLYCCCASASSKQYKLLTRRTKPFFCHIIECVHILLIVGYIHVLTATRWRLIYWCLLMTMPDESLFIACRDLGSTPISELMLDLYDLCIAILTSLALPLVLWHSAVRLFH